MNILSQALIQRDDPPLSSRQIAQLVKLLRDPNEERKSGLSRAVVSVASGFNERLDIAEQAKRYIVWLLDVVRETVAFSEMATAPDELGAVMADFGGTTGILTALDNAVKELRKVVDRVNQATANAFAMAEMQSCIIRGKTVYLNTSLSATIATTPDAADEVTQAQRRAAYAKFKELGYGDLVSESIHAQRLSSWVKEHQRDNGIVVVGENIVAQFDLPDDLKPLLNVTQRTDVRVRKGK